MVDYTFNFSRTLNDPKKICVLMFEDDFNYDVMNINSNVKSILTNDMCSLLVLNSLTVPVLCILIMGVEPVVLGSDLCTHVKPYQN